ncbi:hypothetical protein K1719_013098 [Acacia pycnantha]|nr:hypothetical protein K1719_013098 [Acacia pycnantha]
MGACWSNRIKAVSPSSTGFISRSSSNLKSFSYSELRTATRNFRRDSILGEGGFGSVFKGWIDEHSFVATKPGAGIVMAVKRLNQDGFQGHNSQGMAGRSTIFKGFSMGLLCYLQQRQSFFILVAALLRSGLLRTRIRGGRGLRLR